MHHESGSSGHDDVGAGVTRRLRTSAAAAGWHVRRPRDQDGPALAALVGGVFAEYPGCVLDPEGLDADLFAWASHLAGAGGTGWVVVDEDRIVACVGVAPSVGDPPDAPAARRWAELKRLYVHADARRRGLGTALVAQVEAWAAAHDVDAIVLWSDTRFADAHRLYTRCGYRRTGRSRELHDPSDTTEDEFVRTLTD